MTIHNTSMMNYLEQLNNQQREAVIYCDGPQLIIAGAGSGKTRVLTYKIVHLLQHGYTPYRIMALTFTNKAAKEMRERIEKLVGLEIASKLWMGTFHSIFAKILRRHSDRIGYKSDFTIYDTADSRSLIKLIIKDLALDDKIYNPKKLQSLFSSLKNDLVTPGIYNSDDNIRKANIRKGAPRIGEIYDIYCRRCKVAGAMDFDDLLLYTNILIRDNKDILENYQDFFQYILVDEYQDTNFSQHKIIVELTGKSGKLSVVGDDAQSIYSFRGANISNILNLGRHYPDLKTFKLEQNYRSTQTIINAANSLIDKNLQQIKKTIFTENKIGSKIPIIKCFSDYEEGYVVASQITSLKAQTGCSYNDIAVLYRTNAQSRVIEQALSKGGRKDDHALAIRGIPYRIYGGLSFYQRKEIKDAIAYFRLTVNHDDDEALRRIINYPLRGIGDTTVTKIQHAAVQHSVSMWAIMNEPGKYNLQVNKPTLAKLAQFVAMIDSFSASDRNGENALEVSRQIIARTGLISNLLSDNTPENISKRENLEELASAMNEFVETQIEQGNENTGLSDFLALTSLLTDQDEENKNGGDCVTLMTVHAAKGLEFRNVIIVGVEEDLFPSAMSLDTPGGLEEERRLLYVAITRAKENCVITFAASRYRNGQTVQCNPSRFIFDINPEFLKIDRRTFEKKQNIDVWNKTSKFKQDYNSYNKNKTASTADITYVSAQPERSLPPAGFKRYDPKATPAKQFLGDGKFSLHSVYELKEGLNIVHNRFGEGKIIKIDTTGSDPKIVVDFISESIPKTLLLKFAKFYIND